MAIPDRERVPGGDYQDAPRPGDRLLSAQDLATYLEIPVQPIYNWRHRNFGPPGFRIGKHLRFRSRDVEAWLDERIADEG